jgi:N-acetylglucosamine kinase-like BadF-type ATPase
VRRPDLLAVDGGGSKVDAALVSATGEISGAARVRNNVVLVDGNQGSAYLDGVALAVDAVCKDAGLDHADRPIAALGVYCLAGADLPADDRRMKRWLSARGWTSDDVLRNDTFAVLRAGTERTWGVAVVCGYGTNCVGVSPDGSTFRFPAVGGISGDWGGGMDIGQMALWYAIRAQDGRGEATSLAELVPAHFGLARPRQVTEAMHFGKIDRDRLVELPPIVFGAAAGSDPVARSILVRQADEVVAMAGTAIRKLGMTGLDVHVVLGGGIFHNDFPPFFDRIEKGLRRGAPNVRLMVLRLPPVVGAALLGLDQMRASDQARAAVRTALSSERLAPALSSPMRED